MLEQIKYYLGVMFYNFRLEILKELEYAIYSIAWLIMIPLSAFSGYYVLWLMTQQNGNINGWTIGELAFLYGLSMFSHAFQDMFFIQTRFIDYQILEGSFDRALLRPMNVFFQFCTENLNICGLYDLIPAIALFAYGCQKVHFVWNIGNVLGVVFGQRTQLNWDLRLGETFELLRRIYRVPEKEYLENVAELTQVLGLTEFMDKPVRQLSLGQRMRGEMAAAMLHSPEILFLDEPTIGLDIDAKKAVRDFILKINRERGVTVILTSHDLEDVSKLCDRLIVINHGVVVRDGKMDQIIRDMAPYRILKCETAEPVEKIRSSMVQLMSHEGNHMICRFDHHQHTASEVIGELVKEISILDLTVEEPNIEDAVMELYHA